MSTIKIFLASSDELKPEREMMASLANSLNTVLEQQGVHVIVVEWENLDASMGIHHKQDDYNEKLRDCEMCLVLYWTKFGMYTKTELDTAYKELQAGNNPRKLYVYFKNGAEPTEELKEFRDSFPTRYGHFFTPFENFDTLKAHFLLQFMEYQSQVLINTNAIEIKDGKVVFGGIEYVNLKNVPFAGNNEEYNEIKDEIAELQEDLENLSPDSPRYAKKSEKLQKLQEKLSKMENSLWDTALMITRLSTTKCSERLKRAMDLFSAGDNKGAQAVLNEEEIERDVEHNLHLIQLGEEGKKGLKINIDEYQLKIKTLTNEMAEGWEAKVYNIYNLATPYLKEEFLKFDDIYHFYTRVYECLTEYIIDCDPDSSLNKILYSVARNTLDFVINSKNNTPLSKIESLERMAHCMADREEYDDSLINYEKALSLSIKENSPHTFNLYTSIGSIYYNMENYNKAVIYFEVAKNYYPHSSCMLYIKLGNTSKALYDYTKAVEYYNLAIHETNNIELKRRVFQELGECFFRLSEFDKAQYYLTEALIIVKKKYERIGIDYKQRAKKIMTLLEKISSHTI